MERIYEYKSTQANYHDSIHNPVSTIVIRSIIFTVAFANPEGLNY